MKDHIAIKIFGFAVLLSVILIIGFAIGRATTTTTTTAEQTATNDEMLVVIEDHAFSGYYIVYDKDTKIIYYRGINHGACLDPLYNSDGTLKLYNGGN